ncbi:T9SS type A sorting domain-containing protein [Flavivirga algicola]|uniref:T9SS type A sorting domain-containing protein n=1 Tax=Flavivirga algicola TaxID=2729136 RepID=A0ABX1RZY2_9FLAO|nr:T9SS type A sorting domain-containing protein [Flavivirga algicola]NMH88188.1 T9SS type A sorting domain-containing protein [Flavivirga algicola]
MRKITLLLLLIMGSSAIAQRVEPTFVWSNKSNYQINGEDAVTFKPGDAITIEMTYTMGSTGGVQDAFDFILAGLQDEAIANHDVVNGVWANETVAQPNDYAYPGAGTGGVVTANYTIPADAELSSANATLTYRILTYLAYTPDGGSTIYGGDNASDPTLVYIRSQAEIDAILSTEDFNKNKLQSFYSASKDAIVIKDRIDSGYSIYNLLGQEVLEGEIANAEEISVASLKSGLYILSTKEGTLKFVK